jgi:hypothetical protein
MRFVTVFGCSLAAMFLIVIHGVAPSVAAGGSFSASYSGTFSSRSCGFKCTTTTYSGKGRASFLLKSDESLTLTTHCVIPPCGVVGTATLVSRLHTGNSITMSVQASPGLCCRWSVVSGTGKFAHATGSGQWAVSYGGGNAYTDQWAGTLQF